MRRQTFWKWLPGAYVCLMGLMMLGYVRYDPYQVDGDAVSYMDIASNMLHGRWHGIVNGLWNPGYPAFLAAAMWIAHPDRMHELQVFYWVNFFIFLISIACTAFFVRSILFARTVGGSTSAVKSKWLLCDDALYIAAYAAIFLSWQHEFSLGKIRVDGLFASLLLVAFGYLFRIVFSERIAPAIGMGVAFGLAYIVKSPGFIVGVVSFSLLAVYLLVELRLKSNGIRLLIAAVSFLAVAGPYIAALSLQKGRIDIGDSGRLNYAWSVSGTDPLHLLNHQPTRDGYANVRLKHPQVELMSNPGVVFFPNFPHATYGPWFDPSYFNEGVNPRFSLPLQIHFTLRQIRHLCLFVVSHSLILALLAFAFAYGSRIVRVAYMRRILYLVYGFTAFCFLMYLCVLFKDRYVAGMFWLASIATLGMLTYRVESDRSVTQGAVFFMAIVMLLDSANSVMQMRQRAIFSGVSHGWDNLEEFEAAGKLNEAGVGPGADVACFRACNTGSYWARVAGVHVISEIFDQNYIADTGSGTRMWRNLPNRSAVIDTLRKSGVSALVGYFEEPPGPDENWRLLSGHYYWMPLAQTVSRSDDVAAKGSNRSY